MEEVQEDCCDHPGHSCAYSSDRSYSNIFKTAFDRLFQHGFCMGFMYPRIIRDCQGSKCRKKTL